MPERLRNEIVMLYLLKKNTFNIEMNCYAQNDANRTNVYMQYIAKTDISDRQIDINLVVNLGTLLWIL